MPARSVKQQRLMGMAMAMQRGKKVKNASAKVKKVAKTMDPEAILGFAKTKTKGLPPVAKQKKKVVKTLKRSKGSLV